MLYDKAVLIWNLFDHTLNSVQINFCSSRPWLSLSFVNLGCLFNGEILQMHYLILITPSFVLINDKLNFLVHIIHTYYVFNFFNGFWNSYWSSQFHFLTLHFLFYETFDNWWRLQYTLTETKASTKSRPHIFVNTR